MRASRRSPPLLLPHLERAQRTTVGEMLGEELAQQSLMCARVRCVVERGRRVAGEPSAQRVARLGGQHASRRREPAAARAERAAGRMAEQRPSRRRASAAWHSAQTSTRGREAELGDDAPRAGERGRRARRPPRRARERVERVGDGVEQRRIGGVAPEAERELGDRRRAGEAAEIARRAAGARARRRRSRSACRDRGPA